MQLTKNDWWTNKRQHLNKGLLVVGLFVMLVTCVLSYVIGLTVPFGLTVVIVGSIMLFIYAVLMNIVFILLEAIDRQFIKSFDTERREILFRFLFRLAVALTFLYPVFVICTINSGTE